MGRLDGKVALITGGSRGMGAVEARVFAAEGASVVIGDVRDDDGAALAADLGDGARFAHLDVTSEEDWARVIEETTSALGGLHVLVNNAGIVAISSIVETSLADYQRVIDINQTGVFLGMRAAIPAMLAGGGGSIVNISSVEGLQASPGAGAYVASKHAVLGLTKTAALEMATVGVRVNAVCPGGVDTPMLQDIADSVGSAAVDALLAHTAMKRPARPVEIAELVLWLASDASSYCTGGAYTIDGGMTAGMAI